MVWGPSTADTVNALGWAFQPVVLPVGLAAPFSDRKYPRTVLPEGTPVAATLTGTTRSFWLALAVTVAVTAAAGLTAAGWTGAAAELPTGTRRSAASAPMITKGRVRTGKASSLLGPGWMCHC